MEIDQTTIQLFSPLESGRQVGKGRRTIRDVEGLETYLDYANGTEECFVSVYPLGLASLPLNAVCPQGPSYEIDRILFDSDKNFIPVMKRLYHWCYEHDFPAVPVVTAKKGMQLAILSKSFTVDNPKQVVTDISSYILREALGIVSWDEVDIDWTVFGNIAALCRIPNTLRPPDNVSYSSYLPVTFTEMNEAEVYYYSKAPHLFDYDLNPKRSFLDLPFSEVPVKRREVWEPATETQFKSEFHPKDFVSFLSALISRPLMSRLLTKPDHNTMVRFCIEMNNLDFNVNEQVRMIFGLGLGNGNADRVRNNVVDVMSRYRSGEYQV